MPVRLCACMCRGVLVCVWYGCVTSFQDVLSSDLFYVVMV